MAPAVCVYAYDELDDAIERANSLSRFPGGRVHARLCDGHVHLSRLDPSAVMVNDHTAFRVDWMSLRRFARIGLRRRGLAYTFRDMQTDKLFEKPIGLRANTCKAVHQD